MDAPARRAATCIGRIAGPPLIGAARAFERLHLLEFSRASIVG
jgi:hypothetical protein